jgi:hypothetical protein
MVALLNASGYFTPAIKDTIRRDTIRFSRHPELDQYRVRIDFHIWPGKQLKLDSVGLRSPPRALQSLAMQVSQPVPAQERHTLIQNRSYPMSSTGWSPFSKTMAIINSQKQTFISKGIPSWLPSSTPPSIPFSRQHSWKS